MIAVPADPQKGINVAADEEARHKADQVRERLMKGEAFEKVAAEVSDAPSKSNGGLIAPIAKSDLAEPLVKMLSAMKTGEISPVVRVTGGYEILRLESNIESTTLPFEAARRQIVDRLGNQRQGAEMQKYLKKLRSQALIEWKNHEIKKAYETGVAEQEKAAEAAQPSV